MRSTFRTCTLGYPMDAMKSGCPLTPTSRLFSVTRVVWLSASSSPPNVDWCNRRTSQRNIAVLCANTSTSITCELLSGITFLGPGRLDVSREPYLDPGKTTRPCRVGECRGGNRHDEVTQRGRLSHNHTRKQFTSLKVHAHKPAQYKDALKPKQTVVLIRTYVPTFRTITDVTNFRTCDIWSISVSTRAPARSPLSPVDDDISACSQPIREASGRARPPGVDMAYQPTHLYPALLTAARRSARYGTKFKSPPPPPPPPPLKTYIPQTSFFHRSSSIINFYNVALKHKSKIYHNIRIISTTYHDHSLIHLLFQICNGNN